ncbi:unnamed protein product [Paramecium sonneborni]|uniref:Uncharacterized protein n=1 Tax=Paramecium sonneborni TaxID=65129 RepID=A0A8S1R6M1_9CILI|nr:unnamed protein product [Paramecium sonneborni]
MYKHQVIDLKISIELLYLEKGIKMMSITYVQIKKLRIIRHNSSQEIKLELIRIQHKMNLQI